MANITLKNSYQTFSEVAAPYLHIVDDESYRQALNTIEALFEEVDDTDKDPINGLISLIGIAITRYEDTIKSLSEFDKSANEVPADIAMLRLLMEQHKLGVADFPELGDKSLISRILSGDRNLTKQHIIVLSKRFNIEPALFF